MKPEELLTHADFIRSLARNLVIDDNLASDIEQKTYLAALEHPPTTNKSIKGWFSRVMKNLVVTSYRKETRRKKYENDSIAEETFVTPDNIAIRKESLQRLTKAVFSLEEPYFSTILLRFYEDMPAKDVARKLEVPLETVKTRIQRGLNILRGKLDEGYEGNRARWCLALAPIAGIALSNKAAAAIAAASGKSAVAAGSTSIMASFWLKISAAALLIVGGTIPLIQMATRNQETNKESTINQSIEDLELADSNKVNLNAEDAVTKTGDGGADRQVITPTAFIYVSGCVKNEKGEPVKSYDFQIEKLNWGGARVRIIHETVEDDEGRFSFPLDEAGWYELRVRSSVYCWKRPIQIRAPKHTQGKELVIKLRAGNTVFGKVVDDETGLPIKDAIVLANYFSSDLDLVRLTMLDYKEVCIHARTDEEGKFQLRGQDSRSIKITAIHDDYSEAFKEIDPRDDEKVELRLNKGYRIFGKALDSDGKPASAVWLRWNGGNIPIKRSLQTGPDGSYMTPPVRPGRVFLMATPPTGELKGSKDFYTERKSLDIVDRDIEVNFGFPGEYATWKGVLYGYDGKAKPNARIWIYPADQYREEAERYDIQQTVFCNKEGHFVVHKLQPDRYKVMVGMDYERFKDIGIVNINKTGIIEKDINLRNSSSISGVVLNKRTGLPFTAEKAKIRAWRTLVDRSNAYLTYVDDNGYFKLNGLKPGSYEVVAQVEGHQSISIAGVVVRDDESVRDLTFLLSPCSKVKVKLTGFEKNIGERYTLSFTKENSDKSVYLDRFRIGRDGHRDNSVYLESGRWTAGISFSRLGYVQRKFEIYEESDSELVVHRSELSLDINDITVTGWLTYPDGSPVKNTDILFLPENAPGIKKYNSEIRTTTDEVGFLSAPGFKPGRWRAGACLESGATVTFPKLWIPHDIGGNFSFVETIYKSEVKGTLVDSRTGLPFSDIHPRSWKVLLQNVNSSLFVSRLWSSKTKLRKDRFILSGVPDGEYQVVVQAEGYENCLTGAFNLINGKTVDLGVLRVKPCGLLDVKVVNESNQEIKSFYLFCDSKYLQASTDYYFEGFRRFDKIPLKQAEFQVKAKGYVDKYFTLEPRIPARAEVITVVMKRQ